MTDLSNASSAGRMERRGHLELCDAKTRFSCIHVVLVRHGKRDDRGFNDLHAETMFIRAQPVYNRGTIRVVLGEAL